MNLRSIAGRPAFRTLELRADGSLLTEVVWVEQHRGGYLALGLFGCLSVQAAGPVWAMHGTHNTVYLAGSIHMLPPNDAQLPAAFDHAYADSSKVVMELDLGKLDPLEAMSWMIDHGTLPQGHDPAGPGGRATLRARQRRRERRSACPRRRSMDQAPWMVGIEISDSAYTHEGFDPEQGVEEQLLRRVQADGKDDGGPRDAAGGARRPDRAFPRGSDAHARPDAR